MPSISCLKHVCHHLWRSQTRECVDLDSEHHAKGLQLKIRLLANTDIVMYVYLANELTCLAVAPLMCTYSIYIHRPTESPTSTISPELLKAVVIMALCVILLLQILLTLLSEVTLAKQGRIKFHYSDKL